VYVKNDRVHFFDRDSFFEDSQKIADDLKKDPSNLTIVEEKKPEEEEDKKLSAAERRAAREKAKEDAKKEKPIVFNRDKLLPLLQQKLKLPAGQDLGFIAPPWIGAPIAQVNFSDTVGGASLEELKQPTNPFVTALSKVRPPNEVIMFRVDPPSMYAYALAREFVEKKGIACGWELTLPNECIYRENLPIAMNITGERPPPDPNRKAPERARGTGPKLD
jgi:hypothetical protein